MPSKRTTTDREGSAFVMDWAWWSKPGRLPMLSVEDREYLRDYHGAPLMTAVLDACVKRLTAVCSEAGIAITPELLALTEQLETVRHVAIQAANVARAIGDCAESMADCETLCSLDREYAHSILSYAQDYKKKTSDEYRSLCKTYNDLWIAERLRLYPHIEQYLKTRRRELRAAGDIL